MALGLALGALYIILIGVLLVLVYVCAAFGIGALATDSAASYPFRAPLCPPLFL